jgi:hypothetical protein
MHKVCLGLEKMFLIIFFVGIHVHIITRKIVAKQLVPAPLKNLRCRL